MAEQYHVSPKTIRDIWSGRTWTGVTSHVTLTEHDKLYHADIISVNRKFAYLCKPQILNLVVIAVFSSQGWQAQRIARQAAEIAEAAGHDCANNIKYGGCYGS